MLDSNSPPFTSNVALPTSPSASSYISKFIHTAYSSIFSLSHIHLRWYQETNPGPSIYKACVLSLSHVMPKFYSHLTLQPLSCSGLVYAGSLSPLESEKLLLLPKQFTFFPHTCFIQAVHLFSAE